MSCIYSGEFTLTVTKEQGDKIEELFNHSELEGALPQSFEREDIKDDDGFVDGTKISLSLNAEECGYWLEDALEDFFGKVHGVCSDYPRGYVIEDDGEIRRRLEFNEHSGALTGEDSDWLLQYPNWLNRSLQAKAKEILEQL